MDVLADAKDVMEDLGVHFETSASEAAAAAMLSASVMYPVRGAVTWKSTAGTNVASDALSNLSSGGVTGGALIIIGEDYGEGSSIMQERSHAYAMKSQMWLLNPRPNLPSIVQAVEDGLRAVGSLQHAGDAAGGHPQLPCSRPASKPRTTSGRPITLKQALENPVARRQSHRAAAGLLPAREGEDWRSAGRPLSSSSRSASSTNSSVASEGDVGIILLGGMYNGVMRALQQLGLADVYGNSAVPLYVLNVDLPADRRSRWPRSARARRPC